MSLTLLNTSLFAQEYSWSANELGKDQSQYPLLKELNSYVSKSLLKSPILESPTRDEFLKKITQELRQIRTGEIDFVRTQKNQSTLNSNNQRAKSDWFGLNEERMVGVLIRKRDRDRVNPLNWKITDRVEMTRNEEGLLTRLRVRSGQESDTTVFVTDYEYDERGYPLSQRFHIQDSTQTHLFLHLQVHYDSLGRLEHMHEHRYSLTDSTFHDSVMTQFQYRNQERVSMRVEDGQYGNQNSDTTYVTYMEGFDSVPLQLMIHQSRLERSEQSGMMLRMNRQFRYTYPEMKTMLDYVSQVSYFYDVVPFQIDLFNVESQIYREQMRVQRIDEGYSYRLSHQIWEHGVQSGWTGNQSGPGWQSIEEIFVGLDGEGFPIEFTKYDATMGDLYLHEVHEIESAEQATSTEPRSELPGSVLLYQNYPNPFNPVTQITFELMESEWVTLNVYDALGRRVRDLADGVYTSGRHQIEFDGAGLPSGQYYYRIIAGDTEITKLMTLAK